MISRKKPSALVAALAAVVVAASALTANTAFAHGAAKPLHGGIVQTADDLSFELVAGANGATLYVIDHDDELDVAGTTGKLTALNGASKSEADLKPAGGNKLEAKGISLAKGSKVVAVLTTKEKKTITVRFAIK